MARINQPKFSSGKRILLIDDQNEYLTTTISLLKREGHDVVGVLTGEEGLTLLKKEHFDLLLIDYYMPGGMNAEEVINKVRQFNPFLQIILQTGYAGEYPPREMLRRLDIQGYHDKTDGPEKLLMWIDVGLKVSNTVQLLSKSRLGLQYILDVTPELHKIQQLQDLFQGVLIQISGLMGIVNTFLAVIPENKDNSKDNIQTQGFVATIEESSLIIRAATGKFYGAQKVSDCKQSLDTNEIQQILQDKKIYINENKTVVPLFIGDEALGLIFLDLPISHSYDIELLQVFANQAAVAIQNAMLYEMATLDPLTGTFVRRFFDQWLIRELRTCFRTQQTLTLMMIDMDNLKTINDTVGHLAGDKALSIIGKVLRQATRTTDFVSRYGGDEFTVILPQISADNSDIIRNRIYNFLNDKTIESPEGNIPITACIGICGIKIAKFNSEEIPRPIPQAYFEEMANALIKKTDEMLYSSKKDKTNRIYSHPEIDWPSFEPYK